MNEIEKNTLTIGQIVAQDYRTASVFKEAGIDFCCGGNKTIIQTCLEKGLDADQLIEKLRKADSLPGAINHNFLEWDPGFLCDYIVNIHHKFVLKSLPDLVQYTEKISRVHGENHPELKTVADLFLQINKELLQHMKKEEEALFPAIKEVASGSVKAKATIVSEIERLSGEHEFAGGAMDKINEITNHYSLPEDACNTYRVAFELLEKFEDDLHTHVHLENNVLFPNALKSIN